MRESFFEKEDWVDLAPTTFGILQFIREYEESNEIFVVVATGKPDDPTAPWANSPSNKHFRAKRVAIKVHIKEWPKDRTLSTDCGVYVKMKPGSKPSSDKNGNPRDPILFGEDIYLLSGVILFYPGMYCRTEY